MAENKEKLLELAKSIMNLSRNTLLVNMRFLDLALAQFRLIPADCGGVLTDGERIIYDPRFVLKRYATAQEIPVRDYLHIVMHCVFKHMYMDPSLEREYWYVACDIAVENAISELGFRSVRTDAEQKQAEYLSKLKKKLRLITAEKVYMNYWTLSPQSSISSKGCEPDRQKMRILFLRFLLNILISFLYKRFAPTFFRWAHCVNYTVLRT